MNHENPGQIISINDYFARNAQRFVTTHEPHLLIQMDGCREVFVNKAHTKEFSGSFPVVSSVEEVTNVLKAETAETVENRLTRDNACYCYPMGAPVALIADHCVFDRSLHSLRKDFVDVHTDIPAFLDSHNGDVRKYRLYRSRSRRLVGDHAEYVDSEMLQMIDFEVHVRTLDYSASGEPTALRAETILKKRPIFDAEIQDIGKTTTRHQAYRDAYQTVYDRFSEAIDFLKRSLSGKNCSEQTVLADSKKDLLKTLENPASGVEYLAVSGFINGIYGALKPLSIRRRDIFDTITELLRMQERFYDVFLLRDIVVNQIPSAIPNWNQDNKTGVST